MGDQLDKLLDVTIHYPNGIPSYWDYLCGQVKEIRIRVKIHAINDKIVGNYFDDQQFKQQFQHWLNGVWQEKDRTLENLSRH